MTLSLPEELERLAEALQREPSTESTSNSIYTNLGRFKSDWASNLRLRGSGLALPVPRNQGLHPVGCALQSASLDFEYEWRDGDVMPWRAEYQVRVEGFLDQVAFDQGFMVKAGQLLYQIDQAPFQAKL